MKTIDITSQIIYGTVIMHCIRIQVRCKIHMCKNRLLWQIIHQIGYSAKWNVHHWQAHRPIQNRMWVFQEVVSFNYIEFETINIEIKFLRNEMNFYQRATSPMKSHTHTTQILYIILSTNKEELVSTNKGVKTNSRLINFF